MSAPALGSRRLERDRLTLTFYGTFITWGWFLYSFSPAVPLIATELDVSRGVAGLHGTAMALGTIATGLFSSRFAVRLGRRTQSLTGSALIAGGIVLLIAGPGLATTLPACFIISVGGGLAISAAQPALSLHHGTAGPAAVTEGNATGATIGLLAPLALGGTVALGWGWRPAVAMVAVLAVAAGLLMSRLPATGALGRGTPSAPRAAGVDARTARRSRRFSGTFRFFLTALVCGVGIEFATTFWAPDLLISRTGASPAIASASVSALILGMSVSRFVVARLALRKAPEKLLLVAYALAGAGWLAFWVTTSTALAIVGLVLAGLGYGAHYPLSVSLALRASDGRPDQAQARTTIGAGTAVALAPFVLGSLADQIGAHAAFVMVPVLVVIGATAVALGLRSVHRAIVPLSPPRAADHG